ncbi:MAG: hypothetical protein ABI142_11265 [Bryocella sp.]
MITVILLIFFLGLAVAFGIIAYSENNHRRSGNAQGQSSTSNSARQQPMNHG